MASEDSESNLEDLFQQLQEQQAAVDGVSELLVEQNEDPELHAMHAELLASLQETRALIAAQKSLQAIQLNSKYKFRHTDGKWHYGVAVGKQSDRVFLHFMRPTKAHMLSGCFVHPALIKAAEPRRSLKAVAPGSRVLACSSGGLWQPAELLECRDDGVRIMFTDTGDACQLQSNQVAESAFASDSDESSQEDHDPAGPALIAGDSESHGSASCDASDEDSSDSWDQEHMAQERRQSGAGASVSQGLQQGTQTETQTFGSFEKHTRGIGSKLMVGMGYVKGGTLGRHSGGQLHPIEVELFRAGAGLGSDGAILGRTSAASRKKRTRGGTKRRIVRQKFQEREARRQDGLRVEEETGELGVFALVNKQLGDHSEAAKIQRRSRDSQAKAIGQTGASKFAQAPDEHKPQDRRQLMASQEGVAAMRAKIAHLHSMSARNQRDAVMSKQIKHKLSQAESELSEMVKSQKTGISALLSQEKQKKWLKF